MCAMHAASTLLTVRRYLDFGRLASMPCMRV